MYLFFFFWLADGLLYVFFGLVSLVWVGFFSWSCRVDKKKLGEVFFFSGFLFVSLGGQHMDGRRGVDLGWIFFYICFANWWLCRVVYG